MRLAAFAVGYVVENVSCGLLDRIEHWDKRLVLWATGVRVRVPLAHKERCRVVIWATGHFAGAVFRHTLIVEADATGRRRPWATDELQAERSGEDDEAHDEEAAVRNSHRDAFG